MTTTQFVIGIEGGGSKTEWIYLKVTPNQRQVVSQGLLPPANFRLVSPTRLLQMFSTLPSRVTHAGIFLAGCVTDQDQRTLFEIGAQIWPGARITTGSDRDSALATAFGDGDGITVIAGTGSAVTGRKAGKIERAGGRGHLLGDRGGAYVLSIEGLRHALRNYDLYHQVTPLARNILRTLSLNSMEDLISWVQGAEKNEVSALAPVLFETANKGDTEVLTIIQSGAQALALYTASVARWLHLDQPPVRLFGGLFLHQPLYVHLYRQALEKLLQPESVEVIRTPGSLGAAMLALQQKIPSPILLTSRYSAESELDESPTEALHPASRNIQNLSSRQLVDLFVEEEKKALTALQKAAPQLQQGVDLMAQVLRNGGRIFYVGAGTSGRLGVLDASEIPPTFGESPERFQAILAGGIQAFTRSIEGAEDDQQQGRVSIHHRGIRSGDLVCGITASGQTPFVLAALNEAKEQGAKTLLLTCNPNRLQKNSYDVEIDLEPGPELIAGSTRLKAGTATKVALHILSSCSMILLGKVIDGWMVHVTPTNQKLKRRAVRLLSAIRKWSREEAERKLEENGWNLTQLLQ